MSGNAGVDETELAGKRYRNVARLDLLGCASTANPDAVEYNLGPGYSRFMALAGLHDTVQDPSDIWRFAVTTIDGNGNGEHIVFEQEIHFAQPVPVDVSIAGAQRLRLTVQEVDLDGEGSCRANDRDAAVWADPEIT